MRSLLSQYLVFPILIKQCTEPDVETFLIEVATQRRSSSVTNSDGQAPLKSKSCLTHFSLVTYNISLSFVIQLIGENKKQMQTHKEMYLLYHKQLFFFWLQI